MQKSESFLANNSSDMSLFLYKNSVLPDENMHNLNFTHVPG